MSLDVIVNLSHNAIDSRPVNSGVRRFGFLIEARIMRRQLSLSLVILTLLIPSIGDTSLCGDLFATSADESIYNQMVTISGKVTVLNHPELLASGAYIVFQRADCGRCLVATFADAEGNYKTIVGRGKYKIIMYNPSQTKFDMLAPDQPRYVTVTDAIREHTFDIKMFDPER
jgi:hypothetical protein